MAPLLFPLKNCILFGLLYIITTIYDASAQITQQPPSSYEPPSIPLPRWPMEPKSPQNSYHVLPEYAQQKIRQPSELPHSPPSDGTSLTGNHKNPFRPQQPFNPHAKQPAFKHEANWMPQQRNRYPTDRSSQGQGFNPHQQAASNNPAYNNYPYKPQYSKYEPNGPSYPKSPDSNLPNRMSGRFDPQTQVNQPQNNGYTYPKPPPGYYGPEKQGSTQTSDIPKAILEYLQKQQAKDGLPTSLLNYLHSQAREPVPQSIQETTTSVPPVELSTDLTHQAPQHNHAVNPQDTSTESPTMTTDLPTTPAIEMTSKAAVAEQLMAKLSSQLESQSAAVQQLTDSFTTLSPLEASTDSTNTSDALSLQFRKLLLKKLIARRLLTLKTIGNLSKNSTTVAPVSVSESVTATPSIQHHSAQEPMAEPHATSAGSQAPHGSHGQGNAQQSHPTHPAFKSHDPKTTGTPNDITTTISPELLPGERFPPNSHYVGHLPSEAIADPHHNRQANNQFQPHKGHQQGFNPQRPNNYKANPHFGNQHQQPAIQQNAARNVQQKTASASGIPEISYVHSGQQNRQAGASPQSVTATQGSQTYVQPASAQKGLGQVTEPTPVFGAPNEMQTIIIPPMGNPTAKPGMVRVVYIPGKNGAKGFFRVIHVSAPGTPGTQNPSTSQPLSPIQKYFSQDKINNQQYPTPDQLRKAIKQETMIKNRKDPSQSQHGSKVPKQNPAFESPQQFPAVDSTPLIDSQTNVKDSLVGLLNTLEPTKATIGTMPSYKQEQQASNQWKNYSPQGYNKNQAFDNTAKFDTAHPKNPASTPNHANKIQDPYQQYQESTNFQQGNKKQGQSSPNLSPYYKIVKEQIRQNSILTTAATPTTTTSKPIQSQFGYNNVPYGAPWERQHMSNGHQQNHGASARRPFNHPARAQGPIEMTTEQPTTPVPMQNLNTGNRLSPQNDQHTQTHLTMGGRMQHELTGAVRGASASIDIPGNPALHGQHTQQADSVAAPLNLTPKASDPVDPPAAPAAQGSTVQEQLVQQTMMELLKRQPHLLQGNNLQELIQKLSQNMSVPAIDKNLNERTSQSFGASTSAVTTALPLLRPNDGSMAFHASSGVGHQRYPEPKAAPFENLPKMPSVSSHPVPNQWTPVNANGAQNQHSEQLIQANNLQDLLAKLSQNMSVPVTDNNFNINEKALMSSLAAQNPHSAHQFEANNLQDLIDKLSRNISASKSSAPSSSATATGSFPGVGHQRYPAPQATPYGNRPNSQPSPNSVQNQWNPVNARGAQNPQHRNVNQYQREMHMGVYHYQGYDVPTTTTPLPTTTHPLPTNPPNQQQHGSGYDNYGPQSQYPLRGPKMNFPIPIFEHTVLDTPKPQKIKPGTQTQQESNYWKQQNHANQHQNQWQQPSPASNNQHQNQSSVHHNNQWQQPSHVANNQQQQNQTSQNQNQWQQPSPASNNQQQQKQTNQHQNQWQHPSPAQSNQQHQNDTIQHQNQWQQQPPVTHNQQQQKPTIQHQNQWQQQPPATSNQQHQNDTTQHQNQWQQPSPAASNEQHKNDTIQHQNQWQQQPPVTHNQQQQKQTVQYQNHWQQPSPAASNEQHQNDTIQHQNQWQHQPPATHNQQQQKQTVQHQNHWQQPSPASNNQHQNHHGNQQQNQMYQQQNSTSQHQNIMQQQQKQTSQHQPYWQQQQNQTNQYQTYWQPQHNQTKQQQAHQPYQSQYQPHANQQHQHQQQYYQTNPQQSHQQAPTSFHLNKHTGYFSSVVEAKPLQVRMPGNVDLNAYQSSMVAGNYQVVPIENGRTTSSPLVDTLSLQRSPLVDPVSPSGGVPDLTAGLPKVLVSFPGGGGSHGTDVLGVLDPQLLSGGIPNLVAPAAATSAPLAPSTSTMAPNTTTMIPTTTIPPAHTFSSELMCTMQSECEVGCCYTLQGEILWDWKTMVEPPHLPQVGYCHTKASTSLGDGCEASVCPCVSANQVCLSVPPENFTIPPGYDAAEQGAISFGKCMSTAQKKAAVSHMTQAKMLVDMCMSDPSCPLHSMQLQKKKKK